MNQKNIDYLKDGLKYLGFGDKLIPDVEKNMQQRLPEFTLGHQAESGSKKLESTLYFKKSDQSDMYFFNRYEATLKSSNNAAQDKSQTFYITRNAGITAKEAFNLLEGRAVYKQLATKEGIKYNAWQQLDFSQKDERGNYNVRQFHEKYGYELDKSLAGLPIKKMHQPEQQKMLMYSLQKGNLHAVTMERNGKEERVFIEANPQFKTINVYDGNLQKVEAASLLQQRSVEAAPSKQVAGEVKQGTGPEQKKEGIQKSGDDDAGSPSKAPKKKKGKGLSA